MMRRLLKGAGLLVVLMLLAATAASAAAPPPPGGGTNLLRVYGKAGELAPMPYDHFQGPFSLEHWEAPPKDFVVFNPALLRKGDTDSHGQFGPFFGYIKADNLDAHEKVHLRMWYQPSYPEPRGDTHPYVDWNDRPRSPDIILEYTYLLLDDETLNPTTGGAGNTTMVFPMAGFHEDDPTDPPGLDSYDVHGDGHPDIMQIDEIHNWGDGSPHNGIAVSAQGTTGGNPKLYEGDTIQMFDYMVKVLEAPTQNDRKVRLQFYYVGRGQDEKDFLGNATLFSKDWAVVEARNGPVRVNEGWSFVDRPFWITVDTIGNGYVKLTPHRALRDGETFFVDGAEYDVAGIYVVNGGLKYITLRNPIPKVPVCIQPITVCKTDLPQGQDAWVLPPFSYMHDMVDDVNIPDYVSDDPDGQYDDNPAPKLWGAYNTILKRMIEDVDPLIGISWQEETKEERFDTNLLEEKFTEPGMHVRHWKGGELLELYDVWEFGELEPDWIDWPWSPAPLEIDDFEWLGVWEADETFVDCDGDGQVTPYDVHAYVNGVEVPVLAVWDKYVVLDSSAVLFELLWTVDVTLDYCYMDEIGDEYWQWINVETRPWDYTEFVLPQRPDAPQTPPWDKGDYILVGSWLTEDSDYGDVVRMKFTFDPEIGEIHAADLYVNDAEYNRLFKGVDANTLRVYGNADENAAFPYDRHDGPFNIDSDEAPPKDFVVFNPAFLDHRDVRIKADGNANQKVHLRMWYVPEYGEPAGETEPPVGQQTFNPYGDIVMEYTYLLLDPVTNDPTHGAGQTTQMLFPMAGFTPGADGDPIGLDSYDVNGDGADEIMSVEFVDNIEGWNAVVLSPESEFGDGLTIHEGETVQFLDFAITLDGIAGDQDRADLKVEYVGQRKDIAQSVGSVTLWQRNTIWPEADTDAALVDFRNNFDILRGPNFWNPGDWFFWGWADPVQAPFFFVLEYVGEDNVEVKPYRWLRENETFFVDGAEYDVAKIFINWDEGPELKYITLRNPLPKCDAVGCPPLQLHDLTRYKSRVGPYPDMMLPVLPPFDRQHDIIDDVNIPDDLEGAPDVQLWDNPGFLIDPDYDTIAERLVPDQEALAIGWIEEADEPRFDTSLTEEKFTEPVEMWEWINIETMPWSYTEFVLPEIDEAEGLEGMGYIGDYLLVSSMITEDSWDLYPEGSNRVKFAYDASDGTGVYVNHCLSGLGITSLTADPMIVEQGIPIEFEATVTGMPDKVVWDFGDGDAGTVISRDDTIPSIEYKFADAGEYRVTLTVSDACLMRADSIKVKVLPLDADVDGDGDVDFEDLLEVLRHWGTDDGDLDWADHEHADVNEDGRVNIIDIMLVLKVLLS